MDTGKSYEKEKICLKVLLAFTITSICDKCESNMEAL